MAGLRLSSWNRSVVRTYYSLLRQGYGGTGDYAKKSHRVSGKPYYDDGFAALAQLESRRVALGSPPCGFTQSLAVQRPLRAQPRDLTLTQNDRSPRRRHLRALPSLLRIAPVPRKRFRLTRSERFILTVCSMCMCYGRRATPVSTLVSRRT